MNAFLMSIFALVMTLTVESKSSVSGSGDIPVGVAADYNCTYQKGTVRQGDTALLVLQNMSDIEVQKIVLTMHSNKEAGAGKIDVSADGKLLVRHEGSLKNWVGTFDNENGHPFTAYAGKKRANTWALQIVGTVNSLYLEQVEITYQPPQPCSVILENGSVTYDTLTEVSGKSGVVLPFLEDLEKWTFVGWTDAGYYTIDYQPVTHYPGERFYPSEDIRLWSLWQWKEEIDSVWMTDIQSGDYLYLEPKTHMAMAGVATQDGLASKHSDWTDELQIYTIRFSSAGDSATIYHPMTDTYVGYSGAKLANNASRWAVYHKGAQTAFYMSSGAQMYLLWPMSVDAEYEFYTDLLAIKQSQLSTVPMRLLKVPEIEKIFFSCHPENGLGTEMVNSISKEVIVPFGIYEIHICNGKKSIRLRN